MELALSTTATATLGNEQALVQAAREGDDRAFEALYARYRDRVAGFIFSKVRDHGRAEDISQEVFMSALRQLRAGEQEISFKPWIFAIAKNACIDEFRRTARGREICIEADDDLSADHRTPLSIVPSPPAAVESKQRLEDLRGAFGGLSESHHRLLMMREFEGRSYDEIGDRLGMTRQMVESGLFRARRKLTEEYDELTSGRRCEQVQAVIETGAALRLKTLGIKQRRRLTQHLSHCQPCRHQARLAGVDEALLKPRSLPAKIAALLPFGGLWRWPWRRGGSAAARVHHVASSHAAASGTLGSAAGAAGTAGAAGSSITLGQAAAAAAALAIAGAGGGIAIAQRSHQHPLRRPAVTRHARTAGHGGRTAPAALDPAAPGHDAGASAARPAAARRGARATAQGSVTGQRTAGARSGLPHRGAQPPAAPSRGQTTSTRGPGAPSTTPLSSGGSPAKRLLHTTVNQSGQTLNAVTAPVKKLVAPVTDPVTKLVAPVTDPVKKLVAPVTDPVTKLVAPVTNPVLSAPPVKKLAGAVGGTVQSILPSGSGSDPAAPSAASPPAGPSDPGTAKGPLNTITRVLSGR